VLQKNTGLRHGTSEPLNQAVHDVKKASFLHTVILLIIFSHQAV